MTSDVPPYLDVRSVSVHFSLAKRRRGRASTLYAVDDVSLTVGAGEAVGLVGESGSGKSTLGRTIVGLQRPTAGTVLLDQQEIVGLSGRHQRQLSRRVQMVFQDPFSSLNPRMRVRTLLTEPLRIHRLVDRNTMDEAVDRLAGLVALDRDVLGAFPHALSGGQRQRVAIAQALAVRPEVLVCDEPVSALDVSVQAQIINLFMDLRAELGLTMLFIAHDLHTVRRVCGRVAVMYLGRVVEHGPTEAVYSAPRHPYTVALLSASPVPDPDVEAKRQRIVLHGELPAPTARREGCRFRSRCWLYEHLGRPAACATSDPALHSIGEPSTHAVACHFHAALADAVPVSLTKETA